MKDADLYDSNSALQRANAIEYIPYLISRMNWKSDSCSILDFGCGTGYTTKNILWPALQSISSTGQARQIYAVDITEEMINFASTKYQHPNITYARVDVMNDNFELPFKFDKIFAFNVFHWISGQRKALQILYDLMQTKGEIGFFFISSTPGFPVYNAMSKNPVWAPYLHDVQNFIPKTFYSSDPAADMNTLMSSIGFCVHESTVHTKNCDFKSVDEMINTSMAVNPFIGRIPQDMQAAYRECYLNEITPFIQYGTPDSIFAIRVPYQIVVVRGQKQ